MTLTVPRGVNTRKGETVGKGKCGGCREEMETESRALVDRGFSVRWIQGVMSLQSGVRPVASDSPTQHTYCLQPGMGLSYIVV